MPTRVPVAIVEADLRRPTLAKILNVESEPGLTDVLQHVELLPQAVQPVGRVTDRDFSFSSEAGVAIRTEPRVGTLDVVTSGAETESLTAGVAAEGIKSVLARMTEEYDMVLIDSAPLLAVSDCVPLIGVVDGVVMVARWAYHRARSTPRHRASRARYRRASPRCRGERRLEEALPVRLRLWRVSTGLARWHWLLAPKDAMTALASAPVGRVLPVAAA